MKPNPAQQASDAAHDEWMLRHGWGIGHDEMQHLALVLNSNSECREGDTVFTHPVNGHELTRTMANNLLRQYGDFAQGWKAALKHAEAAREPTAAQGVGDPSLPVEIHGTVYNVPIGVQLHIVQLRDKLSAIKNTRRNHPVIELLWATEHCLSAADEGVDYSVSRPMLDAMTTLGLLEKVGRGRWSPTDAASEFVRLANSFDSDSTTLSQPIEPQGAVVDWRSILGAELKCQQDHHSECYVAWSAGSLMHKDECRMTEGVIQGIEYCIARLKEAEAALPVAVGAGEDDWVLWGVVANAGRLSKIPRMRWSHVVDATGLGSTAATALCVRFGFDPDEVTPATPAGKGEV